MNAFLSSRPGQARLQNAITKWPIQAKLYVNTPGDAYEQEADTMSEKVMRMPVGSALNQPVTGLIGASLQRKCAQCEEEEKQKPVMRKEANATAGVQAPASLASALSYCKGGGAALPAHTRNFMENAFSADFSSVRIHTGQQAAGMNRNIQAKAFTYGTDIYFDNGQFNPGNTEGRKLLAHELTHVVQQGGDGAAIGHIQRFTNCNREQNQMINESLSRARRRSTRAIRVVADLISGTSRAAAAPLTRFFGVLTAAQITTIHDRLVAADARLRNNADWQCDTAATYSHCGGTNAWCAGTLCPTTTDPTHLCPPVFRPESEGACAEPSRAILLEHEALRAAGACGGFLPPGDRTTPGSLVNVYSYSNFMYSNVGANR